MNPFPFLCTMNVKSRIQTHTDATKSYITVLKPGSALIAAFGPGILNYSLMFEDLQTPGDAHAAQRHKSKDPVMFCELKSIQATAQKNRVPRENILLVDCKDTQEVADRARNAIATDTPFHVIRGGSLWPTENNLVGLALTDILIDEVWGKTKEQYCDSGFNLL